MTFAPLDSAHQAIMMSTLSPFYNNVHTGQDERLELGGGADGDVVQGVVQVISGVVVDEALIEVVDLIIAVVSFTIYYKMVVE